MGDAVPWVNLFVSVEALESATMDPQGLKEHEQDGVHLFPTVVSQVRTLIE